jgi:hypothetical protein
MTRTSPYRSDEGSGGVLATMIASSLLALSLLALSGFSALPGKIRVQAAADAAAIAAAEAASGRAGGYPCELAGAAAEINGAQLAECSVSDDGEAAVLVSDSILGVTVSVRSRAATPVVPQESVPAGEYPNGMIPLEMLVRVDYPGVRSDPPVYLRHDAATALLDMLAAYHAQTGQYLPVDEGYRDLEGQRRAFELYGAPRAAPPGTSNHGEAIAVDFVTSDVYRGSPAHDWLTANAPTFGFTPLLEPDEPWHWDYRG